MLKELLKEILAEELNSGGTPSASEDTTLVEQGGRYIVKLDKDFLYYGDVTIEGSTMIGRDGGQVMFYNEGPELGLMALTTTKGSEKTRLCPVKEWRAPLDRVIGVLAVQEGGI